MANYSNQRIEIFSETGEYLNQLGELINPYGIAIHENSLFVSSYMSHKICKYSLTDFSLVKEIFPFKDLFYQPKRIAITPNGKLVCVSNNENYGLQIYS